MVENNFYSTTEYINVANYIIGTKALGPGLRSVLWVQGCPFACKGCYSEQWIPQRIASLMTPVDLGRILLTGNDITGITISGGEPFSQAGGLNLLLDEIKKRRPECTIIIFSGYTHKELLRSKDDGKLQLLGSIDVLIDGRYDQKRNDNKGLRGSSNQKVIHLTDRLKGYDFENHQRLNEIKINNGSVQFIGVPSRDLSQLPGRLARDHVRA